MINSPFFLSETLVQALGWTLLHSLWQGAAVAAVLWLVLPRLKNANQRYWFSYASLLSILLAAVVTFVWVYNTQQAPAPIAASWSTVAAGGDTTALLPEAVSNSSFWSALTEWLEPYQPLIVSIWLLGFLFFLIQLAGGLHFMYRLRRQQNRLAAAVWQEKIQDLSARIGCSQAIGLLESALVSVPMALGFFKPIILLPIGMVNQLNPEQVEAILAHELAHIARRDWLFNLFQAIIEAIFYFHPAVWWISAGIRSERENCCDDRAVLLTGNRLAYAKTLVFLQDLTRTAPQPALALSMQGASGWLRRRPLLLQRIKRILHQPQQSTSLMEKTIALAILVALFTLLTLRANTPPALVESIREIAEKPMIWLGKTSPKTLAFQAAGDSLPKPKQIQKIVREDDDQLVELELTDGKISQLKVDGKTIEPGQYSAYQSLTDDLLREAREVPLPPAPPAPFGNSWMQAPAPPTPPFPPRMTSRISTEKDDAGNTLIHLERNGKPLEIRVKDGEVWVGDKRLEAGESLDLPGDNGTSMFWHDGARNIQLDSRRMRFTDENGETIEFPRPAEAPNFFRFDNDGNHFRFEGQEGMEGFEIPHIEISEEAIQQLQEGAMLRLKQGELLRLQEGAQLEQLEQLKAIEKEMARYEKEWKKNRREWSKEQQAQFQALEEAQRSMRDAQRAERDAQRRHHEQDVRIREETRRAGDNDRRVIVRDNRRGGESISVALQNALLKDRLISDTDNFSLDLSGKGMKVNGKKQSASTHRKYLDLYLRKTGKEIGKDKIRIEVKN